MRNLLRNCRGSVAFATVVALVPLIGAIALGAEAGSWYVTKQHAQNAADAAAYSGALRVACTLSGSNLCDTAQDYVWRSKQFAAQQSFCNAGDTTAYPGARCLTNATGTSQSVQVDRGTYAGGAWSSGASGSFVRVVASQQQPAYLTSLLGLSTLNITATAIAKVQSVATPPCALALTGSISFQGSPNINAPNCGMATNSAAANALNFTGGGMSMNLGSLSSVGGCTGAAQFCNTALTYTAAPITNPFSPLDGVTLPTLANCSGGNLVAYSAATPCKNNNYTLTGNTDVVLPGGVYFISGTLSLKGNASLKGTALFILLPGASFSMKGTGTIIMTGNTTVTATQLPSVLQPYASLLANMSIYDRDTAAVTFGGNSQVTFNGTMYLPNAAVTFQGNPTVNGCGELIAQSIAFNGNATFDSTGCPNAVKLPSNQFVQLVK